MIYKKNINSIILGAGISTESGIPDYRSEGVGLYQRSNHKPVQVWNNYFIVTIIMIILNILVSRISQIAGNKEEILGS